MAVFFNCLDKKTKPSCILQGLGNQCIDHDVGEMCNNHLKIFSMQNRLTSYVDGHNNQKTRPETLYFSHNNLSLPLFRNKNNIVSTQQIHQFAKNAEKLHLIDGTKLAQIISCYCGLNTYVDDLTPDCRTWLDEEKNFVNFFDGNKVTKHLSKNLPRLHKLLLKHCYPSIVKNLKSDTTTYMLENVHFEYDNATDGYYLTLTNKDLLLKYTDQPNCVASPLVISGCRFIDDDENIIHLRRSRLN